MLNILFFDIWIDLVNRSFRYNLLPVNHSMTSILQLLEVTE